MEKIIVTGGVPLYGSVKVSGAKNAVLPIIAASLLSHEKCIINEVPFLNDVEIILEVLKEIGARVNINGKSVEIDPANLSKHEAPYELVRKMRASFLVMGPLLARLGKARISLPGGCAIGSRPIDLHLKGFEALGAQIITGHGFIEAVAAKLVGSKIYLDYPSVGATENIMMAASLAEGVTLIENAAQEPEIVDLSNFLNKMGAKITGAGTNLIKIEGVQELKPLEHTVIPDRIEAGTYMMAVAASGGNVLIKNVLVDHLKPVVAKLTECGVTVEEEDNGIRVISSGEIMPITLKTLPYPGFPTDMQPQMMALLTLARGTSIITETVFENRFMHVDELKRMGANIFIEGRTAIVEGVDFLTGAPVKATDLRAGAALIIAGLAARGDTEISCVHHIYRGYEDIDKKLQALGAKIKREDC